VALLTAGERLLLTLAKLAVSLLCTSGAAVAMSMQTADSGALDNANGALLLIFVVTFCAAVNHSAVATHKPLSPALAVPWGI
jgi:hypothetical protein